MDNLSELPRGSSLFQFILDKQATMTIIPQVHGHLPLCLRLDWQVDAVKHGLMIPIHETNAGHVLLRAEKHLAEEQHASNTVS